MILTQNWTGYGSHYFDKKYSFVQAKDTMNIKCKCAQEQNLIFENFKFQKGNFELIYDFQKKYNDSIKKYEPKIRYVYGYQIKVSKSVQNILFKNAYPWSEEKNNFKNLYFKDLKFIEIDLKDSTNVKLEKLN